MIMGLPDRLKIMRESMQLSQKDLAKKLQISLTALQGYEVGRSVPGGNIFEALVKLGFNANWLLTGEGEMKRGEATYLLAEELKTGDLTGEKHYKVLQQASPGLDGGVKLQVYVTGGAGDPHELIPTDPIEEIVVPKGFYSPSIVPVKIDGRSMERTLRDGAVVGVDREDKRLVNGELYAVWLPYQGTVIKRLYMDDKKILLQSDNEEFRIRDIEVDLSGLDENFIQGRVKWVVQAL
jgi:phage repressor protein C with HTH and peptisase S24 domain